MRTGFSELDLRFGEFMERLSAEEPGPGEAGAVRWAAALASRELEAGNACVDLRTRAGQNLPEAPGVSLPPWPEWERALWESGVAGRPGEDFPLVLDDGRLYLQRYWRAERAVAKGVLARLNGAGGTEPDSALLGAGLRRLFPKNSWQRVAAFMAARATFCVISGGPGTGKTTTVLRVLALWQEQALGAEGKGTPLRIALCAPTGKAAARLQESVLAGRATLDAPEPVRAALPLEATTLHRLLGAQGDGEFLHGQNHPLPHDAVVVDEASMVDLSLMASLFEALRPEARVLLLGDRDQLASVEAGAVLGDLCAGASENALSPESRRLYAEICGEAAPTEGEEISPETERETGAAMRERVVHLRENYRFGDDSGIHALGRAVRRGEAAAALRLLKGEKFADLSWRPVPAAAELEAALEPVALAKFTAHLQTGLAPAEALGLFRSFSLLAAVRAGPHGVGNLNFLVERILRRHAHLRRSGRAFYHGRPVMVTRNDHGLKLYNGDIGLILHDGAGEGGLRAFFPAADGSDGVRAFSPLRLPEHETVYAMTVHKSQGSEFGEILLVLPEADGPGLTRELVYTGLTRARRRAVVWAGENVLAAAVRRRVERVSGLAEALW